MFNYLVKLPIVIYNTEARKDSLGNETDFYVIPDDYFVRDCYVNLQEVESITPSVGKWDDDYNIEEISDTIYEIKTYEGKQLFVKMEIDKLAKLINEYQLEYDKYITELDSKKTCCKKI